MEEIKTPKEFAKMYGFEQQTVTNDFTTNVISKDFHINDAFIELCDNSYDARNGKDILSVNINVDNEKHVITIVDNGNGVSDDSRLFQLGGTDKKKTTTQIGKYGIGVPGATAKIALECMFDKEFPVNIVYKSEHNGRGFIKNVAVFPNGITCLGKSIYFESTGENSHYTAITFENVAFSDKEVCSLIDALDETFEIPMTRDLVINVCNRKLGESRKPIFDLESEATQIKVGNQIVDVKTKILVGKEDRKFDDSALRVYDKVSGRLLAKSLQLWSWYANRKAQQNICGLRCGIFIDSSVESYNLFGIRNTKNGVTYKSYHNRPEFSDLSEELRKIYCHGVQNKSKNGQKNVNEDGFYHIGNNSYQFVSPKTKITEPFSLVAPNTYIIQSLSKFHAQQIVELINRVVTLEEKLAKKERKK